MSERKKAKIFPWSMSVTGSWSPETGLYALRDLDADALSDALWEPGIHVQNTAIVELMGHGNPRKAAEVARTLVEKHPVCERSIRKILVKSLIIYSKNLLIVCPALLRSIHLEG